MPVNRHSAKLKYEKFPLQYTPDQVVDPDPQGYVVAIAPLQFHPDDMQPLVPGQLVIPILKAHKALAVAVS